MNDVAFGSVQKSELFRDLDESTLSAMKRMALLRRIEKDAKLLKQGDAPDHLFVVSNGRFRMTTLSKEGIQKTLRFMEVGDVIGCAAVFRNFPYPASATATADSTVFSWTAAQFARLVRSHPQLATNALAMMGGRAEEMLQRVQETSGGGVEKRIAGAILKLLKKATASEASLPISGQELAELCDTTPFTVSRTISAWKRAGILEGGRGRIAVLDVKRLSSIVGDGQD